MAFQFTDARNYRFRPGSLFLGLDPETMAETGIATDRHAITIAGARSGKGAALIIPNLLRWPGNVVTVDPKGENAEATWQAREAMGQTVGVVDPFHVANIPDRLRVSFNPLAAIDPASRTARADIEVIADGLVKRSDPKHAEWDDGAAAILAGLLAYVISEAPPEHRTLTAMRGLLLQPDGVETGDETGGETPLGLYADAQRMAGSDACGGLIKAAGITIMTALTTAKGMEKDFLSAARRQTNWIDDPAFAAVLSSSTFDLSALKTGAASLYLVLPPDYLATKGTFLRLFVRCALSVMAKGRDGRQCLFLLDEFHSLGRLDIVATAAGLMPGYGVHLWPFLQDLGQLQTLYTEPGAHTFFGNSDAAVFFGNTDTLTLSHISDRIGQLTPTEIAERPPQVVPFYEWKRENMEFWQDEAKAKERWQAEQENARAIHAHKMGLSGRSRLSPTQIATLVGKPQGEKTSRFMIVFGPGGAVLGLRLAPYFAPPAPVATAAPAAATPAKKPLLDPDALTPKELVASALAIMLFIYLIQRSPNFTGLGTFIDSFLLGAGFVFLKALFGIRFFKRG